VDISIKYKVDISIKYKYPYSESREDSLKARHPEYRYTYPYDYLAEAGFEGEITGLSTGLYYVTIVYDKVAIAQQNVIISGG
jgi:hypothetical protein